MLFPARFLERAYPHPAATDAPPFELALLNLGVRTGHTHVNQSNCVATRFVPMGGIAYRGQMFEWIHSSDWRAQRSLALTVTPALEATYYSSPSLGWTLRFKPEFSYVIDQIGSPVWYDGETGDYWDAYRWGLTGGVDLGVVF